MKNSGKELLYLVEQPVVDGPATCSRVENFNPQALRVIISTLKKKINFNFNIQRFIPAAGIG